MNRQFILLSILRALIGNITEDMRAITVDYDDGNVLLKYYLAKNPEKFETELIDDIETEVLADLDEHINVTSEIVATQRPIHELPPLKEWGFKRHEQPVGQLAGS